MGRKRTHEEFIKLMQDIHPNIEVLGTYVNNKTKIKVKCKIDEHIWEVVPYSLLNGHGCPKCKGRKVGEQKRRTHEQFITELQQINTDIEILGTYVNIDTPIKCKCKLDGNEWEARPHDLLRGHGCFKCKVRKQRKTHEQFLQDLYKINENIQVLSTYKGILTHIKCKCKIDGYEWETTPAQLLQGHGCHKCAGVQRYTHEEFMQELYERNIHAKDIEVLGTYVNIGTKIKVRCKIDGHEWEVTPGNLLQGNGCPKCAGKMKKTHEQFLQELYKINTDIEVLGTYVTANTKILCRCKIDEYEWEARPIDLLRGIGCPKCSISKGEKRVAQYLDNLNIPYIYDKKYFNDLVGTGGGVLRPDFIIASLKIWIEYDGQQHFEPVNFKGKMSEQEVQVQFKYTQQNDQIKNQYAKDNNWTLIRIPYWDYDNIEQILDSYLKQEEELAL